MVLKARNVVIPVVGAALVLQATSCKKDKDSNTDLLVGEWEIAKINGAVPPPGFDYIFKFEADEDFSFCYQYGSSTSCYDGTWDWHDDDEDQVDFTWSDGTDTYAGSIEIDDLSKDQMDGNLSLNGYTFAVELEKVD